MNTSIYFHNIVVTSFSLNFPQLHSRTTQNPSAFHTLLLSITCLLPPVIAFSLANFNFSAAHPSILRVKYQKKFKTWDISHHSNISHRHRGKGILTYSCHFPDKSREKRNEKRRGKWLKIRDNEKRYKRTSHSHPSSNCVIRHLATRWLSTNISASLPQLFHSSATISRRKIDHLLLWTSSMNLFLTIYSRPCDEWWCQKQNIDIHHFQFLSKTIVILCLKQEKLVKKTFQFIS